MRECVTEMKRIHTYALISVGKTCAITPHTDRARAHIHTHTTVMCICVCLMSCSLFFSLLLLLLFYLLLPIFPFKTVFALIIFFVLNYFFVRIFVQSLLKLVQYRPWVFDCHQNCTTIAVQLTKCCCHRLLSFSSRCSL